MTTSAVATPIPNMCTVKTLYDEDMDEYFADYYNGIATFDNVSVDEYVYQSESDAQAMLDQINDRIEGEEKITFTQYKQWQQDALKQ